MRTLKQEEFDKFVEEGIALRQTKLISKNHQEVKILPEIAEKLSNTHLYSSNSLQHVCISQEWKSTYDAKSKF